MDAERGFMSKSAFILITNDSAYTRLAKPMLLARVMGTSLLT